LVRLDGGELLAAHDYFGPNSPRNCEGEEHLTSIYRSRDDGGTWQRLADIEGAFWSTLFVHRGAVYLLGTSAQHGSVVIRRSTDGGSIWTDPADEESGLLLRGGRYHDPPNYHCAPTPVMSHEGRLYRACENNDPFDWPRGFRAIVISAEEDADLLRTSNWRKTNEVPYDQEADPPEFGGGEGCGWLEGNVVAEAGGSLYNIMRVQSSPVVNKAAILRVEDEGRMLSFDARNSFVDLPGGMSKFTIRFDPRGDRYWMLSNDMRSGPPRVHRNRLSLFSSVDLRAWTRHTVLLEDRLEATPEDSAQNTGFQYVDWHFDGDDIIYLVRTAYDGAHNYHDSNRITFGRVERFRRATEQGCAWSQCEEHRPQQ
jgi:hypothetical protein